MDKTNLVVAFFVAAVLTGLFLKFQSTEHFEQKAVGMPLNSAGMGPYDSVSMGDVSGWAASEPAPIVQGPPSLSDSSNQLMLLGDNKVDSDCCPSAFTNDMGCVCLSEQDKQLFASRGGNRA